METTAQTIQTVDQVLAEQRQNTPYRCRRNYDTMSAAYRSQIRDACNRRNDAEYARLAEQLWYGIETLGNPANALLPPRLPWRRGEPAREYLARCYAADPLPDTRNRFATDTDTTETEN